MDLLRHDSPMPGPRCIIRIAQVILLIAPAERAPPNESVLEVRDINSIVNDSDLYRLLDGDVLALVAPLGVCEKPLEVLHALEPFVLGCVLLGLGPVGLSRSNACSAFDIWEFFVNNYIRAHLFHAVVKLLDISLRPVARLKALP